MFNLQEASWAGCIFYADLSRYSMLSEKCEWKSGEQSVYQQQQPIYKNAEKLSRITEIRHILGIKKSSL